MRINPTPLHEQDMTEDQFFNQSLTGLNLKFSFSLTSWFHTFSKDISAMWNANSPAQDLISVHGIHFRRR